MAKNLIPKKSSQNFLGNPCNSLEPCLQDEDYDPCGSTEDLTEKDLAILLKEEASKRQKEIEMTNKKYADVVDDEKFEAGTFDNKFTPEKITPEKFTPEDKKKKKNCKNFSKAPFFSSPLNFSSCLPPPPPAPPPQYFPLTETFSREKLCPQREKKRKGCEKQKNKLKYNVKQVDLDEISENNLVTKTSGITSDHAGIIVDVNADINADINVDTVINDDKGIEADVEDEADDDMSVQSKKEEKKKKCRKKSKRPPCKKISDISISLLPPQIPPLQKDLPEKSPKDIPEVNRQILMACRDKMEQKCKKKTGKEKEKRSF